MTSNDSEGDDFILLGCEDGDSMFLRNVDIFLPVYTTSQPKRTTFL
jgi:hypothetical protein